jgi:hypothetical protein
MGADDARPVSGGRCCRLKKQGEKGGESLFTTQRRIGEGMGVRDVAVREIEGAARAPAGRRQAAARARGDERSRAGASGGKVQTRKLWSYFIERRGGRGATTGSNGLQFPWRAPAASRHSRGGLIEVKRKGVKKGE